MDYIKKHISHLGDILAIFLIFPWLIYYFSIKEKKTDFEMYLLIMVILGFFADLIFTTIYLRNYKIFFIQTKSR